MISSKRLSKIIQTRDSYKTQSFLLELYHSLSKKQKSEIKKMFVKNAQ